MPQTITNSEIIDLINGNVAMLDALNSETEEFNRKNNELSKRSMQFIELMDKEYGYGNWHNVDAKNLTFQTREEFSDKLYVIANPAVREKIEIDNVELKVNDGESNEETSRI